MLPYRITVNKDWVDRRVELGYMTDQGRDRDTEVGGVGGRAQSVVCTERDEMVSVFLSGCHDY